MHSTHANAPADSGPNMPRKGEFYKLYFASSRSFDVVNFENEADLIPEGKVMLRPITRGFPPLKQKPRLRQTRKNIFPHDLSAEFSGYWLVSQELKSVFEAVDPDAFEFRECEFILVDGSMGPTYYLCDMMREVDALDEAASHVKIEHGRYRNGRVCDLAARSRLAFKRDVLEHVHIFRTPYSGRIFCDRVMFDALRDAGFGKGSTGRGVMLMDAAVF